MLLWFERLKLKFHADKFAICGDTQEAKCLIKRFSKEFSHACQGYLYLSWRIRQTGIANLGKL